MNGCEIKMKKNAAVLKIVGLALMAAGILVILFCVPQWFWTMLLGLALTAGGFLMWRFVN